MMKINLLLVLSIWVLCFMSVTIICSAEEIPEEENTIEIEEGIYQVVEDGTEEELSLDSGNVDEYPVDESSPGFDSGEGDYSGSGDETAGEDGNTSADAEQTETTSDSNSEIETEQLNSINNKLDSLHEDNLKLMISMWVLCGLYFGTKLIRGIFG